MGDSPAAHARPVRVFLRLPALFDLSGTGPIFRLARHRQGHHQTALYHRRFSGLSGDDPAGRNINRRHDTQARRKTLAAVAPPGLFERRGRRRTLLVAGEKRSDQPCHLRAVAGTVAGHPFILLADKGS